MWENVRLSYQSALKEIRQNTPSLMCFDLEKGLLKRTVAPFSAGQEAIMAGGLPVYCPEEAMYMEPLYPGERLVVLGGGHIALPLVEFAARCGFRVTVVDDRPSFANSARFPQAEAVICDAFDKAMDWINPTGSDLFVIITRGHRHDKTCLEKLLRGPEPLYVGMIGSRRRVAMVRESLLEEGADPRRLAAVKSPIGLEIGAVTPEEIAISILSQLILRRRKEIPAGYPANRSDLEPEVVEAWLKEKAEPCCMATIIWTQGSVPRGIGAKMFVYPDGRLLGSIGGGCSEAGILHKARKCIGTGKWTVEDIDMEGTAEEAGMVCGGQMKVLLMDIRS